MEKRWVEEVELGVRVRGEERRVDLGGEGGFGSVMMGERGLELRVSVWGEDPRVDLGGDGGFGSVMMGERSGK